MEFFIVVCKLLIAIFCWITFHSEAYGVVEESPWKQTEYGMKRTIPAPPRIITEPGTVSQYPDRFVVQWEVPEDNTEPVQQFNVRYVPVERTIKGWVANGTAVEKTFLNWERNQYLELTELSPNTYYKIEIRAFNKIGSSLPDAIVIKTREVEFDASFTLQSVWGRLEPDKRSLIQCFRGNNLKEAKEIRISRLLNTGQGVNLPGLSQQFIQGHPVYARILFLPSEDQLNRFGAFQCRIVKNETETNIVTLKLPPASLAELNALTPYMVASVGDDIELEVNIAKKRNQRIKWRLNGMPIPEWGNQLKIYLKNVRVTDAGIYECYYDGRRQEGVHALMKLIVRSCPAESYGEFCDKKCQPCYNGGVCHHKYGMCICPAGFTGTNCEIACGANRFGDNCNKFCSLPENTENTNEACALYLFCKPDPYGCSCAPGFRGPECKEHCEIGWYGADCKQQCHCAFGDRACNRITGVCDGGCSEGWSGSSCQIRACQENRFGENCEQTCHCEGGSKYCDKDGYCHSGCDAGWTGLTCQTECPPGSFGYNCASVCHCHENVTTPCDKIMGFCEGNCETGYMGFDCQKRCPRNTYGVNCLETCKCYNGGQCNRFDGSCACTGRWRGRYCNETEPQIISSPKYITAVFGEELFVSCTANAVPEPLMDIFSSEVPELKVRIRSLQQYEYQAFVMLKLDKCGIFEFFCTARNQHGFDMKKMTLTITECPNGRFGRNCASFCHCYKNTPCDKVTGACESGCEAGYMGFNCQTLCPPNSYGVNCRKTCKCANGGNCNRIDGTCACVGRWSGRFCNQRKPQIVAVSNMIIKIGQEAIISCTVDGVPEPLLNIYDSKYNVMDVTVRSLQRHRYQAVGNVTPKNSGTFEFLCTARSSQGYDMKNMTVTVVG